VRFPVILPCVDNYQSMIHFKVRVVVFNATLNNRFFSYIVAVIFIGRGNQSIRRKPPTCSKSLKTLTNDVASSTTRQERDSDSNSQH
jgi:hypothetical protein